MIIPIQAKTIRIDPLDQAVLYILHLVRTVRLKLSKRVNEFVQEGRIMIQLQGDELGSNVH